MILSVSRRTDIPAFYTKWLVNRLRKGYVLVRNPMNYHQVSKISLDRDVVDCIVFWSKNPKPLFGYLDELDRDYKFYFQYTINAYDEDIEPHLPELDERIDSFIYLSKRYGARSVIWRYDPILLSGKYTFDWHIQRFEYIARRLKGYVNTCVFSYLDFYAKNAKSLQSNKVDIDFSRENMLHIAERMAKIAGDCGIHLKTCSEAIDLSHLGVEKSCCIDGALIEELLGCKMNVRKDKNQRETCGCVESIDIGQYNTCPHGCAYCYANFNQGMVKSNVQKHNPDSPLLVGELEDGDSIHDRKVKSLKKLQMTLFD